jgi:CheY-like chemotaxis protein
MLSPAPVTVTIDIGHLEQVIMNLVANSRDAMPGGGRLIIRTEKIMVRAQGPLANRGIPVGAHVCLDVTDTGIGMDEKVKARIFDPFFTTKAPGIGTGLGLSTVCGIVQQANGQILVDSQPGSGTTFRVFLAAAGVAAALLDVHHRTVTYPAEDGGVILLVEDSQALRELLQLTLTGCGYTVLDAEGPHEALRIAESDEVRIDLVITDIVMSGMSGIELGRHLKRQRSDLKVLYMSGYNSEIGEEGLDPSQNFMQKPFGPEALSLRVQQLLATTEPLRSSSSQ